MTHAGLHRRFASDEGGVAAIEFILIAPILVFLLISTVNLTDAISAKRRVSMGVSTLVDLAATRRQPWIHEDDVAGLLTVTSGVLKPYGIEDAVVRLTALTLDDQGDTNPANDEIVVVWSRERRADGTTVDTDEDGYRRGEVYAQPLPQTIQIGAERLVAPEYHVVAGEILYDFTGPLTGEFGSFNIRQDEYRIPRRTDRLHFCESNRPGPDCTDGRNWLEGQGKPE